MGQLLLLSHSHLDIALAREIAYLIERISLNQLRVWFSSDERSDRGVLPGDRWTERVRGKLAECKAVVALVTPRSIGRPWLYFESGFGAAAADLEVIPVSIHVSTDEIALPLGMYQIFELNEVKDAARFLKKLLAHFDIGWDDPMAEVAIGPVMERVLEIASREFDQGYEITVFPSPEDRDSVSIPVAREDQVQDILDNVYYSLSQEIPPHSYLERWVLRDVESQMLLIVRGLSATATARDLLERGSEWEVVYLKEPYDPASERKAMQEFYGVSRYEKRKLKQKS